jgi:hypothetical protein
LYTFTEENDGQETISIQFDETIDAASNERDTEVESTSQQNPHAEQTQSHVSTKTTKALQIVLGDLPEVYELERLKNNLSKNMSSHYYKSKYANHLARIQTALLRSVNECKKSVNEWEKKIFCQTGSLPNPNSYGKIPELHNILTKQKVALKLLASWKINVHL